VTIPLSPPIRIAPLTDVPAGAVFMGLGHNSRFYLKLVPLKSEPGRLHYLAMDPTRITSAETGCDTLQLTDGRSGSNAVLRLDGRLEADLHIVPSQIDAYPAAAPAGALLIGESFHALRVGPHASGMYINLSSFEISAGFEGPCAVIRKWSLRLVQPDFTYGGPRDRSKDLTLIDVDIP